MEEYIIDARKKYSKLANLSRRQAKRNECLWCGKKITRFCNSHSVPQCVLKNIDLDGKVEYFNSIVNIPLINDDKGVNEAGTFKLLCSECDSIVFQEYENPENLRQKPNERMLEEIALKNTLVMLGKRYYEIELYKNMKQLSQMPYPYDEKQEVNELDVSDYEWHFKRIREIMEPDSERGRFKLFFWKKLDYRIPIAFQGAISLYGDLEGNMVVDIFNQSADVILKHMHLCMFPLEQESVVFAFYHEEDHEYDLFCEQFGTLKDEEKLALLSYIVYEHSEDMFTAKSFPHRTWLLKRVKETFGHTTEILAFSKEMAEIQKHHILVRLKYRDKKFPNILDKKFSIDAVDKDSV